MKLFSQLCLQLDQSSHPPDQIAAMIAYFEQAEDRDKCWMIALVYGKRPARVLSQSILKKWAIASSDKPLWLWEESHKVVGDWAETVALLLPAGKQDPSHTLADWMALIQELKGKMEREKEAITLDAWARMDGTERLFFNKLLAGGFRMPTSENLMVQALSQQSGMEESMIFHRLSGDWMPEKTTFQALFHPDEANDDVSRPYPFGICKALTVPLTQLGKPTDCWLEWKWDGVRVQIIKRAGEVFIWGKTEGLITDKLPELDALTSLLPDGCVIDGELLAWKEGVPRPAPHLLGRLSRKSTGAKIQQEVPVHFMAFDLLEWQGQDIRHQDIGARREILLKCLEEIRLPEWVSLSERLEFSQWHELEELRAFARTYHAAGFILKAMDAPYPVEEGDTPWRSWEADPLTIKGVLLYATQDRKSKHYTQHAFAVWKGEELLTFTKAASELSEAEMQELDQWIKAHTQERFGPVRSVSATHVFEIGFDGIIHSSRHKSGVLLRNPRILGWLRESKAEDADSFAKLEHMRSQYG